MVKKVFTCLKWSALMVTLPFLYGCGVGGGTSALIGFLFGSGGAGVGPIALLGDPVITGVGAGGAELATLHNPEPASMLLLGGGLAAMSYFKSKKK